MSDQIHSARAVTMKHSAGMKSVKKLLAWKRIHLASSGSVVGRESRVSTIGPRALPPRSSPPESLRSTSPSDQLPKPVLVGADRRLARDSNSVRKNAVSLETSAAERPSAQSSRPTYSKPANHATLIGISSRMCAVRPNDDPIPPPSHDLSAASMILPTSSSGC